MITLREAEAKIRALADEQPWDTAGLLRWDAFDTVLDILATVYRGPETSTHNGVNEAFNALISGEPGNAQ